jgi:hypothetical protein
MIGGVRGYKICFVADRTSMFPVSHWPTGRDSRQLTCRCSLRGMGNHTSMSERFRLRASTTSLTARVKPLAYFWAKYPQWSAKNVR